MSKNAHIARAALVGLAIAGSMTLVGVSAAQGTAPTDKPAKPPRQCFYLSDWHGWSAPNKDTLYLKVRNRDVYRVGGGTVSSPPGTGRAGRVRRDARISTSSTILAVTMRAPRSRRRGPTRCVRRSPACALR